MSQVETQSETTVKTLTYRNERAKGTGRRCAKGGTRGAVPAGLEYQELMVLRIVRQSMGENCAGFCRLVVIFLVCFCLTAAAGATMVRAGTLENVRSRGQLVCGVSDQQPGYASVDRFGAWTGLDVAFCEAVATAVLGSKANAVFKAMPVSSAFRALASGEIDLLMPPTSWTLSHDTELNVRFVDALVHDGQGFMVPRSHGISSALELSGASVCAVAGTRAVDSAAAFFGRHRMRHQLVTNALWSELVQAYAGGACTALTGDITRLAAVRSTLAGSSEHVILPEVISKEPVVRVGDHAWFAIVRWVLMALIEAEELDISSTNVDQRADSAMEDVRRLLGVDSDLGQSLGLDAAWARRTIREVGNYGEIFERNMGSGSVLKLPRGYNNLWSRGGLLYGVPLR